MENIGGQIFGTKLLKIDKSVKGSMPSGSGSELNRRDTASNTRRHNRILHPKSGFPKKNLHIKPTGLHEYLVILFFLYRIPRLYKIITQIVEKLKIFPEMSNCFCCKSIHLSPVKFGISRGKADSMTKRKVGVGAGIVRASKLESFESPNFAERMERAWLISQQPRPVACSSCNSKGHVECKWCSGTGFFIIGDNMLCQVPSRNTTCVICSGKGFACCSDCKGTGYRAKWLGEPPVSK